MHPLKCRKDAAHASIVKDNIALPIRFFSSISIAHHDGHLIEYRRRRGGSLPLARAREGLDGLTIIRPRLIDFNFNLVAAKTARATPVCRGGTHLRWRFSLFFSLSRAKEGLASSLDFSSSRTHGRLTSGRVSLAARYVTSRRRRIAAKSLTGKSSH